MSKHAPVLLLVFVFVSASCLSLLDRSDATGVTMVRG
jgi:hypothetical protein